MNVWDQSRMQKSEITFSNAWGVCDEDLFDLALRRADEVNSRNKPFFQLIMTTSNHRPYTYPQKIDIPSGSGRGGAIRYSDYAIGEFMRKAKEKPWFNNTLFVFVADHNASVAGYVKVPVQDFKIPLIFYMPSKIAPKKVDRLASQIDVAPTLLGLLNVQYTSHFFGQDLMKDHKPRALLGNYQSVGLLKDNILTLLSPLQKVEQFRILRKNKQVSLEEPNHELIKETISYYQSASTLFREGRMRRLTAKEL